MQRTRRSRSLTPTTSSLTSFEGVAHPVAGLIFLQKGASQELTPIDSMSEPELAAVVQAVDLEGLL